jgi:4-diphosphocytidyl-2-C-methyl-D-erythritol kinase
VTRGTAAAKINLALVVGERRKDGLHEVASVLQRVDVCDRLELVEAPRLAVEGFAADTLVRAALERLADAAGTVPGWRVRLRKEIPVAAGLGGGSADAAAALRLANETLPEPLSAERLHELATSLGADVPFFLQAGPKLAEGAGERLTQLDLPQDFWVVIALRRGARKRGTGEVYERFDALGATSGFAERKRALLDALERTTRPRHFAEFPPNDLAEVVEESTLAADLREAGAFRADVSGAGPAVYGLFHRLEPAKEAARSLRRGVRTWVAAPVW